MGSDTPMPVQFQRREQHGHASVPAHATHYPSNQVFYVRECDRRPPLRPPLRDEAVLVRFPRPCPLFFPPPVSLLTVAQARRSASPLDTPRFSYPSSMCSAWRFCLLE